MPKLYIRRGRNKTKAKCLICGVNCWASDMSNNSILKHLVEKHPNDCYKCNKCGELSITSRDSLHKNHYIDPEEENKYNDINKISTPDFNPFKYF